MILVIFLTDLAGAATGAFIDPPKSFIDDQHGKVFELMADFANREVKDKTKEWGERREALLKDWKRKHEIAINTSDVEGVIAIAKIVNQLETDGQTVTVPTNANSLEKQAIEEHNRGVQGYTKLLLSTRLSSAQKYGSYLVKQKKQFTQEDRLKEAIKYEEEISRVLKAVNNLKAQLGAGLEPEGKKDDDRKKAEMPDGAIEFDGHYYFVFQEKKSWTEARAHCENMGGHLVVSNSKREHEFVTRLAKKSDRLWVGMRKEGRLWKWISGDTVIFKAWAKGQPSKIVDANFCALYYGRWYSVPDGYKGIKGFVCEWDSILLR